MTKRQPQQPQEVRQSHSLTPEWSKGTCMLQLLASGDSEPVLGWVAQVPYTATAAASSKQRLSVSHTILFMLSACILNSLSCDKQCAVKDRTENSTACIIPKSVPGRECESDRGVQVPIARPAPQRGRQPFLQTPSGLSAWLMGDNTAPSPAAQCGCFLGPDLPHSLLGCLQQ